MVMMVMPVPMRVPIVAATFHAPFRAAHLCLWGDGARPPASCHGGSGSVAVTVERQIPPSALVANLDMDCTSVLLRFVDMDSPLVPLGPVGGTNVESTTGPDVESTVVPTLSPGFCFLSAAVLRAFQRLDGATCGSNTTPSHFRKSFVASSNPPC